MDDAGLVRRACSGEPEAFTELVRQYGDAVSAVCYTFLGNFDDVQDAAQNAFLQAYLRLSSLRDPAKFGPWVREIAANECRQMLRRRRPETNLDNVPEATAPDETQRTAVRAMVRDALAKLSEKTRLAVTLACINGYTHEEIASFLEVPVNTVRSRLRIAKAKLREEMIEMVSDSLHEDKPGDEFAVELDRLVVRFVQSSKTGVIAGEHEATRLGYNEVATEHLLLGILQGDNVATRVLRQMGFDVAGIRSKVEQEAPRGPGYDSQQEWRLAHTSKLVIDRAFEEARDARSERLHTGYMLLGLLRQTDGLASRILTGMGVDLDKARELVRQSPPED